MATPEVDRLHAIEPWDPRVNDATTEAVRTVGDKLHLVADLTARAAADLGMNGATAEAAAAELDALTKRVRASADGMHAIAQSRTTVTTAGRHAQDTSKQLQKQLKAIESNFSRVTKLSSGVPMGGALLAQATAERDAKHAELEAHASTELASLDHVAVTEGKGLPFQPTEPSSAGRHGTGDSGSASGTGGGGRDPRAPHVSASGGAEGPASSEPGQNMGLPRSATEWRATGLGDAVGSPGHAGQAPTPGYVPGAGSGVGLQGSHYAPQQPAGDHSGAVRSGPARPSGLSSPAVYDPLAAAAATTAGGVIGYKAFQAVRAAKAAPAAPVSSPRAGVRSGAAVRAAPGLRPSGIARGATTAPRATTASASSGSSAPARRLLLDPDHQEGSLSRPPGPRLAGRALGRPQRDDHRPQSDRPFVGVVCLPQPAYARRGDHRPQSPHKRPRPLTNRRERLLQQDRLCGEEPSCGPDRGPGRGKNPGQPPSRSTRLRRRGLRPGRARRACRAAPRRPDRQTHPPRQKQNVLPRKAPRRQEHLGLRARQAHHLPARRPPPHKQPVNTQQTNRRAGERILCLSPPAYCPVHRLAPLTLARIPS